MSKSYMRAHRFAGGGAMPGQPPMGGEMAPMGGDPIAGGGQPPMDGGMPPAQDPSGGGAPDQQIGSMLQAYGQNRSPELAMQIADMMLTMQGGGDGSMGDPGGGDPMSSDPSMGGDPAMGGGGGGEPQYGKGGKMPGMKGGKMPSRKFGQDKAPAKGGGKFMPFPKKK